MRDRISFFYSSTMKFIMCVPNGTVQFSQKVLYIDQNTRKITPCRTTPSPHSKHNLRFYLRLLISNAYTFEIDPTSTFSEYAIRMLRMRFMHIDSVLCLSFLQNDLICWTCMIFWNMFCNFYNTKFPSKESIFLRKISSMTLSLFLHQYCPILSLTRRTSWFWPDRRPIWFWPDRRPIWFWP